MHPSPKYQQVARDLLQAIEGGRIKVGDTLPTEAQLCTHYGVSRITVRAAISALCERGLVRRHAGVGTHVLRRNPVTRFVHTSESVESVLQFTASTHFQVLDHFWVDLPAAPGRQQPETGLGRRLCVRGLRLDQHEHPICLSEFHFLPVHQSVLEHLPGLQGSVILMMEKVYGVSLHTIEQIFDAVNLTAQQGKWLRAKRGDAALRAQRWHQDVNGQTLIYSINIYPSDRYSYRLRMQRTLREGEAT